MQPFLEHCAKCDEPTGRAGQHEDSLYAGPYGPYCENCYADLPDAMGEALEQITRGLRSAERGIAVEILANYRDVRRFALGLDL